MRKKIKSYQVFTSFGYRMVIYVLMPLLLVAFQLFFLKVMGSSGIPAIIMVLILAEIVADNWFLGGIQEKDAEKIDYLKTSSRGMKVMKSVLVLDFVRRLIAAAGIFGVCNLLSRVVCGEDDFQSMGILLFSVLVSYSLSVLGTFIARFGSYLWTTVLTGYFASVAGLECCILVMLGVSVVMLNILFGVLGAGVTVVAVKIAIKKVEEGYYDK